MPDQSFRALIIPPRYVQMLAVMAVALWPRATVGADEAAAAAEPPAIEVMSVDDARRGMTGTGKTVLLGTEISEFGVEVLGVMKSVSPGRDMVLCRLSGAGLEHTGVAAGMSGSPVYIDGKLLGAVAYTSAFNKEPIAGVTPFEQMRRFAAAPPVRTATIPLEADGTMPVSAVDLGHHPMTALADAVSAAGTIATAEHGEMQQIAIPLAASGFTAASLELLGEQFAPLGMLPIASGAADAETAAAEPENPIVPGAVLGVSLVSGDFDLSGLGTVTHVEGNRVWGWGHPFMSTGGCTFQLRSGYVHLVNAKQDLSTKMGSALSALGVIDSDVSTCVAGTLGRACEQLPVNITVCRGERGMTEEYHVGIVPHPQLTGPLLVTVLQNALATTGAPDAEQTLKLEATIRPEGLQPITIANTFSGVSTAGTKGVMQALGPVATIADGLLRNPFREVRIEAIDCRLETTPGRTSAAISKLRLTSVEYEPGDVLRATVTLRPYKGAPVDVELALPLPTSLPPGDYTATVCDAPSHLRSMIKEQPQLLAARSVEDLVEAYRVQLRQPRQTLYLRVPLGESGVAVDQAALPRLPASVRAALRSRRATVGASISGALVSETPCEWVIEGLSVLPFTVVEHKNTSG